MDLSIQISFLLDKCIKRIMESNDFQESVILYYDDVQYKVRHEKWEHRDAFNLAKIFLEERLIQNIHSLYNMNFKE